MGWDDPLPDGLQPGWEHWKADLVNLEKIEVPRCIVPAGFGRITKREIHHFSDASMRGYGQCSYLRLENEQGDIHCSLLMAKSRVAPLKVTTIPRLELTAAVVSVAVNDMLKEEMNLADAEAYFWTDSQVVLGYINNEARKSTCLSRIEFREFIALQLLNSGDTFPRMKIQPTMHHEV